MKAVVAVTAAAALFGAAQAASPPLITNNAAWSASLVSLHNQLRSYHFVGFDRTGNVTWDAALAAGAQTWAQACSFQHSNSGGQYGENLYTADPLGTQTTAAEGAMESWYNEVTSYNFNTPGWNPNAGHFTQVVWKGSTAIGCGGADCTGYGGVLPSYVVCRYAPAGNMDTTSAFAANVLPCGVTGSSTGGCKSVNLIGSAGGGMMGH